MSRPRAPKGSELGGENAKSLDIDEPAPIIESGKRPAHRQSRGRNGRKTGGGSGNG